MGFRTYDCPTARECGGCEWLAVPYPRQLQRKQDEVERCLGEMARHDGCTIAPIRGMDEPTGYRNKASMAFAPGEKGRLSCGLFAAGTHRIVPCESCLAEDPRLRKALLAVQTAAERVHHSAYDEDRGTGLFRHAVARCGYATDDLMLVVVTSGPNLPRAAKFVQYVTSECPEVTTIVQNINDRRGNAILGSNGPVLMGPGIMHDKLLGCTFEIGPTSFYQTNPRQTEVLYDLAIEGARLREGDRVLDAYCGTGTIGICAASKVAGLEVTGVERVGNAVSCARRNAEANGVGDRCRFVKADATEWMSHGHSGRFDAIIMDPPRAGSTPEFLGRVARLAPRRVAYVSCNVHTQARDLAFLHEQGYRMESATPVDMFPHTKHVETVVVLNKVHK